MKFACDGANLTSGQKIILGIRPEFIRIEPNGALHGTVYSALPSGMETIVTVDLGTARLTSVIFGSVDFKTNEPVEMNIVAENVVVFDAGSTNRLEVGKPANL